LLNYLENGRYKKHTTFFTKIFLRNDFFRSDKCLAIDARGSRNNVCWFSSGHYFYPILTKTGMCPQIMSGSLRTTRRHNPEDCTLHNDRRDSLKSNTVFIKFRKTRPYKMLAKIYSVVTDIIVTLTGSSHLRSCLKRKREDRSEDRKKKQRKKWKSKEYVYYINRYINKISEFYLCSV
jgi:hypothetical protein